MVLMRNFSGISPGKTGDLRREEGKRVGFTVLEGMADLVHTRGSQSLSL